MPARLHHVWLVKITLQEEIEVAMEDGPSFPCLNGTSVWAYRDISSWKALAYTAVNDASKEDADAPDAPALIWPAAFWDEGSADYLTASAAFPEDPSLPIVHLEAYLTRISGNIP